MLNNTNKPNFLARAMPFRAKTRNPALETDQNARFAGDLAAQLGRSAA